MKLDQLKPEYLKLNPNAVVPTLVHDGRAIWESSFINEYLDETFRRHAAGAEGRLRQGAACATG